MVNDDAGREIPQNAGNNLVFDMKSLRLTTFSLIEASAKENLRDNKIRGFQIFKSVNKSDDFFAIYKNKSLSGILSYIRLVTKIFFCLWCINNKNKLNEEEKYSTWWKPTIGNWRFNFQPITEVGVRSLTIGKRSHTQI